MKKLIIIGLLLISVFVYADENDATKSGKSNVLSFQLEQITTKTGKSNELSFSLSQLF